MRKISFTHKKFWADKWEAVAAVVAIVRIVLLISESETWDLRLIVPVPRVMAPSHNSGVRLRVSHWPFKPPLLVTGHRRRSSFPQTRPYVTMQSVICVCVSRIYRDSDRSHLVRLSREPRAPQFLSCSPGNFLKMAQVASGGPHLHQHILTTLRCWK